MIDRRYRQKILTCIKIITIFLVMTAVIAPFYVSVIYALKDSSDISVNRLAWPQHPTINNFVKVITENEQFITGYKNSILTTIPAVLILMTATSMAAYVLARFNGRFYRSVYMIFVSGILIPIQCIMLPLYLNFFRLGLTNSNLGFVIARTGLQIPISILVVTGFVKTVPLDLEEAARIDGCNRFTMFWKIVFPLMKPVNATQLVLNTLFIWNDYTTAVILLRKVESRTLLLAQMAYFNEYTSELNLAFAFFILAMLPILILYFCMQKYVVSGIMMGAVKG
ncbi:ABC transporter permease subunit [Enterocloster citroniae]|nr:carbohydrate ABC transporter permease [Enterocloster citroniae]MBT9813617.1 ABC transporter permease subunit [Enterocloster citroniae]MCC3384478.1 ABC transporter permease subunit [Enterocloster citroniae]RGC08957.1 carbohydrate ABC transporter permease [Enterocloster citroniae]